MPAIIKSYRDLLVWQKGIDLAVDVYALTRSFPSSERFGLASQIQRAAVSIPSNIAEGNGKIGPGHYLSHLGYSRGSLFELETDLIVANRVGFVKSDVHSDFCDRTDEVGRMLNGLIGSVAASGGRPTGHRR